MFSQSERVRSLLEKAIDEMELVATMSASIQEPNDFGTSVAGMTVFRACSMSIQYITESFVKIRNLCGQEFFLKYNTIPWTKVFGMRNFLSHEYVEVDEEAIFGTIKEDLPALRIVAKDMLKDLNKV